MARDRVVLPASAEQVTSEVVDMFSRGGRPLACHIAKASVEMTKFARSAPTTMFY